MGDKSQIDLQKIPSHIAVIMDGNGRWAKSKGGMRIFGHRSAIQAVRETAESCAELGVKFLTLYAFSTENWNRPRMEVEALMALLVETIKSETATLQKNNIRLNAIGNIHSLPQNCQNTLAKAMEETKDNTQMVLTLALSYGARNDMTLAMQKIAQQIQEGKIAPNEISEETIKKALSTANMPDPELMIRTSGELRISNFLLWELAYAELYVTPKFWPDFRKEDVYDALLDFQGRERRFGKTSEQIQNGTGIK
jgi:undecaprenyl diphosphate synthase